jgi:hypothetical protein
VDVRTDVATAIREGLASREPSATARRRKVDV